MHSYDGKKLETKCLNFIFENGTAVLQCEDFTNLCPDCVEQIVKSDELVIEEVLVYNAVLRWAGKECGRRGLQVSSAVTVSACILWPKCLCLLLVRFAFVFHLHCKRISALLSGIVDMRSFKFIQIMILI